MSDACGTMVCNVSENHEVTSWTDICDALNKFNWNMDLAPWVIDPRDNIYIKQRDLLNPTIEPFRGEEPDPRDDVGLDDISREISPMIKQGFIEISYIAEVRSECIEFGVLRIDSTGKIESKVEYRWKNGVPLICEYKFDPEDDNDD